MPSNPRLSVPSYVIPAAYAENVRTIVGLGWVDSVEILFYYFDEETRELFESECEEITAFQDRLEFTVHLPHDLSTEHEPAILLTRALVTQYVVHPPAEEEEHEFLRLLDGWRERFGDVFLLENLLDRGFERLVRARPDLPLCCDTGHLLLRGEEPRRFVDRHGPRIREVHLHGLQEGKDHRPFEADESWWVALAPWLHEFTGVLNFEVFSLQEAEAIHEIYGDRDEP